METTAKFQIPAREDVSANNQAIFDDLQKNIGFVPNLYAYYAKNETALGDYLNFQNRKSTLRVKEKEAINIAVSQYNNCRYCQSAHTAIGKMNGFTEEQILELRKGSASFDNKLDVIVKFALSIVAHNGNATEESKNDFFAVGYTEANMIDVVMVVGEKIISNYIHNLTRFEIDFPIAQEL